MKNSVPRCLKKLADKLPLPLYITGGAVRNFLAELFLSDIDICSALSPEEFCEAAVQTGFSVKAVYSATFTVNLSYGEYEFEYTSFRTEKYLRGHNPVETVRTNDIREDALRRDFKCNAVYYDIKDEKFVDVVGGIKDIKSKIISAVKNPDEVFRDDGLRIMRLARLCGELGFTPEEQTLKSAAKYSSNLNDIKPERIFKELALILSADQKNNIKNGHYSAMKILHEAGALHVILPEVAEGENIVQRSDYHKYDVLEHTLRAVKYAEPEVRLAALLHDVGKPYCYNLKGNFYEHDKAGADIAANILKRLKAPVKLTARIKKLVALHMYDNDLSAKTSKIRKFIIKNYDIYRHLLKLRQADYSAGMDDLSEAPGVIKWEKIRTDMINADVPLTLNDLKIDGNDLLSLGFEGKAIKEALSELFWHCVEYPDKNEKNTLLLKAENIRDRQGRIDAQSLHLEK